MSDLNPTKRFSSRVENYVRYRPSYPAAVLEILQKEIGLTNTAEIADIGSGTGLLSQLFLENGNPLYGIEPNDEMRQAGEAFLTNYPHFRSVNGTAEATTLPDNNVDVIMAGQAFHWFDHEKCRPEFQRILRPGGYIVLIWNEQWHEGSALMTGYRDILDQFATKYDDITHKNILDSEVGHFVAPSTVHLHTVSNEQRFDLKGFLGRAESSSYNPLPDAPNYEPFMAALHKLFAKEAQNGEVRFLYQTNIYWAQW